MELFNFFKRQQKTELTPEQTISRLVVYMPDFYRAHRQFIDCTEFLEHHEWGLALDSLIQLAIETEHYFSEDFWLELAKAADKMELTATSDYCRKQIKRNEQDIKSKTPFGWTTIKFDGTHFQHHISDKIKGEWATERREKDKVNELLTREGMHLKSHGPSGYIYYVANGKIAEIDFELGIDAIIIYFSRTVNWEIPKKLSLTVEEKQNIRIDIINWALKTNNVVEFDD